MSEEEFEEYEEEEEVEESNNQEQVKNQADDPQDKNTNIVDLSPIFSNMVSYLLVKSFKCFCTAYRAEYLAFFEFLAAFSAADVLFVFHKFVIKVAQ